LCYSVTRLLPLLAGSETTCMQRDWTELNGHRGTVRRLILKQWERDENPRRYTPPPPPPHKPLSNKFTYHVCTLFPRTLRIKFPLSLSRSLSLSTRSRNQPSSPRSCAASAHTPTKTPRQIDVSRRRHRAPGFRYVSIHICISTPRNRCRELI